MGTGSIRVNEGLGAQVLHLEFSQVNKHRLHTMVTMMMMAETVVAVTNDYGHCWVLAVLIMGTAGRCW